MASQYPSHRRSLPEQYKPPHGKESRNWRYEFVNKWIYGFRGMYQDLADHLAMTMPKNGRILDVGCGPATVDFALAKQREDLQIFCLDYGDGILDIAHAKAPPPNIHLVQGSATRLPFPDKFFQGIHSSLAIHHFPNKPAAFREMHRVLADQGVAEITDFSTKGILPLMYYFYRYIYGILKEPEICTQLDGELFDLADAANFNITLEKTYRHRVSRHRLTKKNVAEPLGQPGAILDANGRPILAA